MDKEKIRKTLLELGFKTDSNRDKYFFMEVDSQDWPECPNSLEYSDAYTELTVEIDKRYFSYLNVLKRWERIKPGFPDENIISYREIKYRVLFKTEEFLWQLIKMHGTNKQRRVLKQLHDYIETELPGQKY